MRTIAIIKRLVPPSEHIAFVVLMASIYIIVSQ